MSDTTVVSLARMAKYECVWHALYELGFDVCVHFAGSGDSGEINDVTPNGLDIATTDANGVRSYDDSPHSRACLALAEHRVTLNATEAPIKLTDLIEELANDNLINAYEDWWNDDGGNGTLVFQRACTIDGVALPDTLVLTINIAIVSYEECEHELDRFGTLADTL